MAWGHNLEQHGPYTANKERAVRNCMAYNAVNDDPNVEYRVHKISDVQVYCVVRVPVNSVEGFPFDDHVEYCVTLYRGT